MSAAPVQVACKACGSTEVVRDAWATWSVGQQAWQLGTVFDHAYCYGCEAEARLVEQPVQLATMGAQLTSEAGAAHAERQAA